MGYSSVANVVKILAKALTSFTPSSVLTQGSLLNAGNSLNTNQVTLEDVNYYISLADGQIDAALSEQYAVPVPEVCDLDATLSTDVDEYGTATLADATRLHHGDILVFVDGVVEERSTIDSIDGSVVTLNPPLSYAYSYLTAKVKRVKFPDPIPYTSARLAAAALYEKYFSAQASPNNSEYFKTLYNQAMDDLNNIREGRTILWGANRIGARLYAPTIVDRYALAPQLFQDGTRSQPK